MFSKLTFDSWFKLIQLFFRTDAVVLTFLTKYNSFYNIRTMTDFNMYCSDFMYKIIKENKEILTDDFK